jgi:preprotein translocase subunit SecA
MFDDVQNDQRKVVYSQRTEIMGTPDLSAAIRGITADSVGTLLDQFLPKQAAAADWDLEGLAQAMHRDFDTRVDPKAWIAKEPELEEQALRERVVSAVDEAYAAKEARFGAPVMRHIEKQAMLQKLDQHWREHLAGLDYLRQGIHLRGYAQKDPKFEFKREAFEMFSAMLERIKFDTSSILAHVQVRTQEEIDREEEERRERLMRALQAQHPEAGSLLAGADAEESGAQGPGVAAAAGARPGRGMPLPPPPDAAGTFVRAERKVGRNEPCPCGSGKKYKHCHGTLTSVG